MLRLLKSQPFSSCALTACVLLAGALPPVTAWATGAAAAAAPAAGVPVVSVPRIRARWTTTATVSGHPVAWAARSARA